AVDHRRLFFHSSATHRPPHSFPTRRSSDLYVTPITIAIYAIKCRDAVIFSPHPGSRKTTNETVRVMRAALRKLGAAEDLLQCVRSEEHTSELQSRGQLVCRLLLEKKKQQLR